MPDTSQTPVPKRCESTTRGYHCPNCKRVFPSRIGLLAHFAENDVCDSVADLLQRAAYYGITIRRD